MTNTDVFVLKCTSCDEEENELYYCDSCSQSEECSNEMQRELLCESCIGHHVRRGHDVRTSKGQDPVICSEHKKLHTIYCKTCDTTFCLKCMESHCSHEMGSIDAKAIEIKKEVFEILTKLELDEKPLRAKKESVSELKQAHEVEQSKVRELFEGEIDELRRNGLKRIDENLSLIEEEEKNVLNGIDYLLCLEKDSRDLLARTSPGLIKEFKQIKFRYDDVCRNSEQILASNLHVTPVEFGLLKEHFDRMGKEILDKLQTKLDKNDGRMSLKEFAVKGNRWLNYLFTLQNGKLNIARLKIADSNKIRPEKVGEIEFIEDVKSYFSISDRNYMCSCVIFTHSPVFVYRIDISERDLCQKTNLTVPSFPTLVCPYSWENGKVHWCYWLADRKVLKFSHESNFEIQCCDAPMWKSRDDGNLLCFTTERSEILIVNLRDLTHELVPLTLHGVNAIDHLTIFGNWLFIWSVEFKSIVCISKQSKEWAIIETQKWHDATQMVSFQHSYVAPLRCVPALHCNYADDNLGYSFITLCR